MERIIRRFWWGGSEDKKTMHWLAWDKIKQDKSEGGLGFTDFRDFNVALLAKQTWRFLRFPNSLVSRVFQAKYFNQSNILDYVPPRNSQISYAMKSILAGRNLVKSGLMWRIANGNNVKVFGDCWIPRPSTHQVITPCPQGMENLRVNSLIEANTGCWNLNSIRQILWQVDEEVITSIQIHNDAPYDTFYWKHSDDGMYTVSSGYAAQRRISSYFGSTSSGYSNAKSLHKLWSLRVPKKIIYPTWRLLHCSLPVASRLVHRGIPVDPICQICRKYREDDDHLFTKCKKIKEVWDIVMGSEFLTKKKSPMRLWILELLDSSTTVQCEKLVSTIWSIWRCRNKQRFEGTDFVSDHAASLGLNSVFWHKESLFRGLHEDSCSPPIFSSETWKPPSVGLLKLNCDASWMEFGTATGIGAVLRNNSGDFVGGRQLRFPPARTPLIAEITAILAGLEFASEIRAQNIQVESDSLVATTLLNTGNCGKIQGLSALSELRDLIQRIHSIMKNFESVEVKHIRREGNKAAHLFASKGLAEGDCSFYSITPIWAIDVIRDDIMGVTNPE